MPFYVDLYPKEHRSKGESSTLGGEVFFSRSQTRHPVVVCNTQAKANAKETRAFESRKRGNSSKYVTMQGVGQMKYPELTWWVETSSYPLTNFSIQSVSRANLERKLVDVASTPLDLDAKRMNFDAGKLTRHPNLICWFDKKIWLVILQWFEEFPIDYFELFVWIWKHNHCHAILQNFILLEAALHIPHPTRIINLPVRLIVSWCFFFLTELAYLRSWGCDLKILK